MCAKEAGFIFSFIIFPFAHLSQGGARQEGALSDMTEVFPRGVLSLPEP